jgi:hypothetical protein
MNKATIRDYFRLFSPRIVAFCCAIFAGVTNIAALWLATLSSDTLLAAAKGVILLLISMGLLGEGRLSLFLAAVITLPSLWQLIEDPFSLSRQAEFALLIAVVASVIHIASQSKEV